MFDEIKLEEMEYVRVSIKACDSLNHFQQVVYSVHKDRLTKICFDCKIVTYNQGKK
jgi:hypothetical protein